MQTKNTEQIIQFKRGLKNELPQYAYPGEPVLSLDSGELYIGNGENQPLIKVNKSLDKIIIFVFNIIQNGVDGPQIMFPANGIIKDINAVCTQAGTIDTKFNIEKITYDNYINGINNWESILIDSMVINANMNINNTNYVINNHEINKNDFLRINILQESDIKNLTIQVIVEV